MPCIRPCLFIVIICSFTQPFIHSCIHSFLHLVIHLFSHSFVPLDIQAQLIYTAFFSSYLQELVTPDARNALSSDETSKLGHKVRALTHTHAYARILKRLHKKCLSNAWSICLFVHQSRCLSVFQSFSNQLIGVT